MRERLCWVRSNTKTEQKKMEIAGMLMSFDVQKCKECNTTSLSSNTFLHKNNTQRHLQPPFGLCQQVQNNPGLVNCNPSLNIRTHNLQYNKKKA